MQFWKIWKSVQTIQVCNNYNLDNIMANIMVWITFYHCYVLSMLEWFHFHKCILWGLGLSCTMCSYFLLTGLWRLYLFLCLLEFLIDLHWLLSEAISILMTDFWLGGNRSIFWGGVIVAFHLMTLAYWEESGFTQTIIV